MALCPVHLNSSPGSFLCFLSTKACTVPLGQKSSLCKSLRCLHRQRASPKHLECAFCPWRGLLLVSLVLPPGEEARGHTAPTEARVALERAPPTPTPGWNGSSNCGRRGGLSCDIAGEDCGQQKLAFMPSRPKGRSWFCCREPRYRAWPGAPWFYPIQWSSLNEAKRFFMGGVPLFSSLP